MSNLKKPEKLKNLDEIINQYVFYVLYSCNWNQGKACVILGRSRSWVNHLVRSNRNIRLHAHGKVKKGREKFSPTAFDQLFQELPSILPIGSNPIGPKDE